MYKAFGFFFIGIAAIGVILPLLPTTPFLLLAAACFARSSEKWHQWLLQNKTFGPIIHNWHTQRCISKKTKITSVILILIAATYSIGFALQKTYLQCLCLLLILYALQFIIRLKTCPNPIPNSIPSPIPASTSKKSP